jgi:phenylpyruvate tautomerase PptA (4-oxalocrotonate tautomerase family)
LRQAVKAAKERLYIRSFTDASITAFSPQFTHRLHSSHSNSHLTTNPTTKMPL